MACAPPVTNHVPASQQVSLTPMKDQHGCVVNFVGVLQNTSDRKAVEAAFQLRDLSRPSALSSLSEGISIADPNLNDCPIVYVNDAFCRMTGFAREDVLHKNCRFLQGPDTDPAAVEALRRGIAAGKEVSVELLNYRKDGQRFWNLLTVMPVHDGGGRVTSLVGVQNDITELVRGLCGVWYCGCMAMLCCGVVDGCAPPRRVLGGNKRGEM